MRKYSKEDIYKPKKTSNTAIYSNLQQSPAIFGNLPVPVTLPGTATAYTVTARKEGRKSAYINIRTAQLQNISSSRFLKYSQCSQNILYQSMLPLILVSLRSGGIRKELHFLQRVDLRESTIHLQHRIVHIIVIYVFCMLLKLYQ